MSSPTSRARATILRDDLRERDAQYLRETGLRSAIANIRADVEWAALYDELKELEKRAAGAPRPGCCAYYVSRKRRFCASKARDGGTMCTLHRAFEESPPESAAASLNALCRAFERGARASVADTDAGADDDDRITDADADANIGKGRKKTNMNRRMKKMTNPLAAQFREAKALDDAYWRTVFVDATRPLLVDVGTAKGGFVKALAGERADACSRAKSGIEYNLLGVEIYEPLVEAANAWTAANKSSLKRDAHFVSCNVNVSLSALNLPNVRAVCVQFPDPWSRGKHVERRVMTPDFARALADILPQGGELYCCSDVRALAEEMYDVVAANEYFELDEETYARVGETRHEGVDDDASRASASECEPEYDAAHQYEWQSLVDIKEGRIERVAHRRWLRANPYECSTERDVVCEGKHRPVFRFAAVRN